ncbi:MAG TPA: lipoprotein-releasing system transmembrane subunit LolC, partial [Glaciecola sp.]|nr:lipoprotein-releasing system transmembrane subunit LolC [Glaciecola sp.]
ILVYGLNPLLILLDVPLALSGDGQPVPVLLQWYNVLWIMGVSLLLCVLATLPPALKALRLQPAQSLKYE